MINETGGKRVAYIDVMRGIGIFLVVFAHIHAAEGKSINGFIYTFHMPLFFFVSGFVYKKKEEKFQQFLRKKIAAIVVPYFCWAGLSFLYWSVIERSLRSAEGQISVTKAFFGIFLGEYQYLMFNVVLWFLPVLFGVEIAFEALMRMKCSRYLKVILLVLSGTIGLLLFEAELPWGINKVFRYLIFYAVGYACSKVPWSNISIHKRTSIVVLWGGVGLLLYFLGLTEGIWFYIIALAGIFAAMMISILLQNVKLLQLLGRNTLAILVMHGPFYRVVIFVSALLLHTSTEQLRESFLVSVLFSIFVICFLGIPIIILNKYLPWMIGKKKVREYSRQD